MRLQLLPLLALPLVACPSSPPEQEVQTCATISVNGGLRLRSSNSPPSGTNGTFESWGSGEGVEFVDDDGESWRFWVEGAAETYEALPDLTALGRVRVFFRGSQDPEVGGWSGHLQVTELLDPGDPGSGTGDTILVFGSRALQDDDLEVGLGRDVTTCPTPIPASDQECSCWSTCHPTPIVLTVREETLSVLPGEVGELGEYTGFNWLGWTAPVGDNNCADADTFRFGYAVAKTSLLP